MSRKAINKGQNLKDQVRGLLGSFICIILCFAGLGAGMLILEIDDNKMKAILLIVNAALNLILMTIAVIFTYKDERKLIRQGRCPYRIAGGTLILALVLEAIVMFIDIAAAMDYWNRA